MKKNIRKFLAAVSAAVLCAVPMMNGINASANEYVLKSGSFINADINHDQKVDITDYNYFLQYLNGNDATKATLKKKFPLITVKDYNGNGITDKDDAELIKFAYSSPLNLTYKEIGIFLQAWGYINRDGKKISPCTYGDANGDLMFSMQDIVALSNYFKNPSPNSKYYTPQILFNRSRCVTIKDHPNGKLVKEDYYHHLDRMIERLGDANGNGRVDMSDAVTIDQYIKNPSKYPTAAKNIQYADINGDGKITKADMTAFEQVIQKNLGYIKSYYVLDNFRAHVKESLISYLDLYNK